MSISTHENYLDVKDELTKSLEKVMYAILIEMSLEELKNITWFSSKAYKNIKL